MMTLFFPSGTNDILMTTVGELWRFFWQDLFAIAQDQPFRFPSTFTFVLRAFSTLEGYLSLSLSLASLPISEMCLFDPDILEVKLYPIKRNKTNNSFFKQRSFTTTLMFCSFLTNNLCMQV